MKRLKLLIFFAVLVLTTNAQSSRVTLARDLHGKQYEGKEEIFENGIGFVGFSSDNRYVAIYPREKVYYQTEVNDRYRFVGRKIDKTTMEVWMMGMGNDPTLLKLTKGCRQVWMRGNTVFYTTDRSLCQFEVE
ncbi:MAG: hypothetical protein ACI3YI_01090 [Bacteroidaceae bacterium]